MFSLEDERRRKINLGGVSVTSSQASILERVHAQRVARAENKRRADSATRIQAWYRGMREARTVRIELRKLFEEDVLSLTALRCLVLIGKDDEVLSTWASSVLANGKCWNRHLTTSLLIFLRSGIRPCKRSSKTSLESSRASGEPALVTINSGQTLVSLSRFPSAVYLISLAGPQTQNFI